MGFDQIISLAGVFLTLVTIIIGVQRHNEAARGRMYARFDEFKKEMEERVERNYVRKDVHDLHIQRLESDIKEIKVHTAPIPSISANLNLLLAKAGLEGKTGGGV
jgi:hypothetical protein